MRKEVRTLIGVSVLFGVAACGGGNPPPVMPAGVPPSTDMAMATPPPTTQNASVSVMDNFFSPADVTVSVGGTVTWTWAGVNAHTVTSNTGAFDSSPPRTTGTFAFTFPNA